MPFRRPPANLHRIPVSSVSNNQFINRRRVMTSEGFTKIVSVVYRCWTVGIPKAHRNIIFGPPKSKFSSCRTKITTKV